MSDKTKNGTKSRYSGMVAPPLVQQREAMDMRISVKPEDLARLGQTSNDVMGAAEMVKAAADEVVAKFSAPHKRLHRRVQITVQDEEGVQLAQSVFDLKESDELISRVSGTDIRASITRAETA